MAGKPKSDATDNADKDALRPSAAATLQIETKPGEHHLKTLARISLDPGVRHAQLAMAFAQPVFGDMDQPSIMDSTEVLAEALAKAQAGDKRLASRLLAAQAITLDSMFTELARRAALNMGEYINAAELYGRLALKAQSNCRATLEALAKLHQPREQTVRHVHVNEGGQAVIADQFNHHAGATENGKSVKQSDATCPTGRCASLPCPDPLGNGVPIPSRARTKAVPNARGN